MSALMTYVEIPDFPFRLNYKSKLLFMGSCFSDAIGKRMKELKFSVCHNPFGVIYNPLSLSNNLRLLLEKEAFTTDDLSHNNELWFSYSHYSLFSDINKDKCLAKINDSFINAREFIRETDVIILTLGTSWAFELKETGTVVANCHKLPATHFNRYFIPTEKSVEHFKETISILTQVNPAVKIIVTISPVRHWKDGAMENQRSKAALILAAAALQKELDNVYYFPAYEIFMDELRDYRFYAADMLHPSEFAIDYTWQKFAAVIFSPETRAIINDVERILDSLKHKPRHTNTLSYRKFIQSVIDRIESLGKLHPYIDFHAELEQLKENV